MKPVHPLLRAALFVVLYLGCLLLLGVTMVFILGPMHLPEQDFNLILTGVAGLLSVLAATGLMLALFERQSLAFVGLSLAPGWRRELGEGILAGWLFIGVTAATMIFSSQVHIRAGGDFRAGRALFAAAMLLLAAGAEELLFRGYGFQRLVAAVGPVGAVAALSALFALAHLRNPAATPAGLANTVLVGVLLALAYLRTLRLWLPIGLHWGWNLAEASLGFPVSGITIKGSPLVAEPQGHPLITGGAYGPEASLVATLVILAGTAWLLKRKQPAAEGSHA